MSTRNGTRSRSTSAELRRAQRTAAIPHWRRAGASMAVGTVHPTLTRIRRGQTHPNHSPARVAD